MNPMPCVHCLSVSVCKHDYDEVEVSSFGYKFSSPDPTADLVIDCRRIPNPHSTGGDDEQKRARVLAHPLSQQLLAEAMEHIMNGGRHVAFGCQYGRHRSYALARELRRRIDSCRMRES